MQFDYMLQRTALKHQTTSGWRIGYHSNRFGVTTVDFQTQDFAFLFSNLAKAKKCSRRVLGNMLLTGNSFSDVSTRLDGLGLFEL